MGISHLEMWEIVHISFKLSASWLYGCLFVDCVYFPSHILFKSSFSRSTILHNVLALERFVQLIFSLDLIFFSSYLVHIYYDKYQHFYCYVQSYSKTSWKIYLFNSYTSPFLPFVSLSSFLLLFFIFLFSLFFFIMLFIPSFLYFLTYFPLLYLSSFFIHSFFILSATFYFSTP